MPERDPEHAWHGQFGLVHHVTLKLFGDRLSEFEIYFAGPAAMAKAIQQMLYEKKVPPEQVHFDQFF
jgi:toluene monooxygenase electron transfer component